VKLRRLEIEDFGLIAHAALDFADGLTACTGETGSGKTMLLGALAFVLGERTSAELVRAGAARARVTLEVDPDAALRERFAREGFEIEADELATFSRELQAGGKSSARINGRPAGLAQVRAFGELLVDSIGQHEQQRLLSPAYQLDVLDRFAGARALETRAVVAAAHLRASGLEAALRESRERDVRGLAELEFARDALAEIEALGLRPGEEEELRARRDYLNNAERIGAALALAHEALAGDGAGLEALGRAAAALAGVARFAAGLERAAEALAALQSDAGEAAAALARLAENAEFDAAELERVVQRLDAIERARRKYGRTPEEFEAARLRYAALVEREETRDERLAALESELSLARAALSEAAETLHAARADAAASLETRVTAELAGLAMPAARFGVSLEPLAEIGPNGRERAEFALSANPGEPARPLLKAASGGELSRVLLALVVVLAGGRDPSALVFDEIDAGIGGSTANAVGVRLGSLARVSQVVCVTHLSQIASWADRHYALRKREARNTTTIEVLELRTPAAVIDELARMLSGSAAGVARDHAATLLDDVRRQKNLQAVAR